MMKYFNSRCLNIILLVFIFCSFADAQNKGEHYYYYISTKQFKDYSFNNMSDTCQLLYIDYTRKAFQIGRCWDFQKDLPEIVSLTSSGKISYRNNILYCFDRKLNRTYKFKYINSYTIEALNYTFDFVRGTRLYLHVKESENSYFSALQNIKNLFATMYWKNGIRNGVFYWRNDEDIKIIYYKNNIALDSVITTMSDKNSTIKIQNFMKIYN
ncbi:MAG: hypothetical protein BWY27_01013 [Bacteroidetes bacterium ADurb.Bin234]|nr:MAG: hypothetical protein BWY27_01013 [Bacteroidetes bacterium ADurb.Bin234]